MSYRPYTMQAKNVRRSKTVRHYFAGGVTAGAFVAAAFSAMTRSQMAFWMSWVGGRCPALLDGDNVLRLAEWRHIERLGAVPEHHHGAHVGDFVSAEGEQRHQRAFNLLHGADEDEGWCLTPDEDGQWSDTG